MEFYCWDAAFFGGFVSKLHFQVLNLTLAPEWIIQNLNVHCAIRGNIRHFQLFQILQLTDYREHHRVHDSIDIFVFKLEDKVLQQVPLQQSDHVLRVVQILNRRSRDQRMRQFFDTLALR